MSHLRTTTVRGVAVAQTLTRDAAGRLTAVSGGATTGAWSYDGRGNISSATFDGTLSTYSYSASNPEEVTQVATTGQPTSYYAYDGGGDTTSITNTSTLHTALSYDAEQRLVQVTLGSPITETISLAYNAFGQRASYTVTPAGKGASLVESFKYQGDQLAQVAYSGSSITTPYTDTYVYTQDGNPLELLRQAQGASAATPYWYVLDGQGNVVALTTQSGTVVDSYRYDQWGRPISISEPSVHQQLRYAGYWYDNELGWYWLSVRAYDPVLARFLQPDPSELEGLFSYAYAGDSPSDLGDASGLVSTPLQPGCLLTTNDNYECNVAVNSDQWNKEIAAGATPIGGELGSWLAALMPIYCGSRTAICLINGRAFRSALSFCLPHLCTTGGGSRAVGSAICDCAEGGGDENAGGPGMAGGDGSSAGGGDDVRYVSESGIVEVWQPGDTLPNAEEAVIPKEKFTKYLLVAKGKVEAFIRAGFNVSTESAREVTAADIMKQIEDELPYVGAYPSDPLTKEQNVGPRFTVPIGIFLPDGNVGLLETQWAIDYGSDIPRFLTAWLKV